MRWGLAKSVCGRLNGIFDIILERKIVDMKLSILIFMLLVVTEANAATLGSAPSCEEWFKGRWMEKQNGGTYAPVDADKYWLTQYLSGIASSSGIDFMFRSDAESFYRFVDTYCKQHPQDNLSDAGGALASELIDKKMKK